MVALLIMRPPCLNCTTKTCLYILLLHTSYIILNLFFGRLDNVMSDTNRQNPINLDSPTLNGCNFLSNHQVSKLII